MDPTALELARERLRRAERALDELRTASNFREAEDAWSDFLLAANAVFSKLERGALGHGKSRAWFGRVKHQRKSDPLLRYLHFARNSDEHGIERVTTRAGNATGFGDQPLRFGERIAINVFEVDPVTHKQIGEAVPGVLPGPHVALVRARDSRYGDYCDPPQSHLGNDIIGQFPDTAAELAVAFLKALIDDAAALRIDSPETHPE
jgi:hypothetical protein